MEYRIKQTKCPQCEEPLNTTHGVSEIREPKVGDVCFCLDCGCVSVLDENMQLRFPTEQEMAELDADPKFHEAKVAIQDDLSKRSIH